MDTELFERLVYELHANERVHSDSPARFCRPCREHVEILVPLIDDALREAASDDIWRF